MKYLMIRCAVVALLGLAALTLSDLGAAEQKTEGKKAAKKGDKALTISEIMKKSNAKGGLRQAIIKELEADTINWDAMLAKSKDLYLLGGDLERNSPPIGEKKSWEKLTKNYVGLVADLEKAVEKKKLDATKDAVAAINKSCEACHKNHRKPDDE